MPHSRTSGSFVPYLRTTRSLALRRRLLQPSQVVGFFCSAAEHTEAETAIPSTTSSSRIELESLNPHASRLGLDPSENRFHAPFVYHEEYSFDGWPESHTFPMDKFRRLSHALLATSNCVTSQHSRPLVRDVLDFFRPLDELPRDWLEIMIHAEDNFCDRFIQGKLTEREIRSIGFREQTVRPELIRRTLLEVAGTVLTCQLACQYGIAANLAGGTHHAHPTGGAGYTILNDLAVAAHFLTTPRLHGSWIGRKASGKKVERVLVVDCDVHQGDGTAKFSTLWKDQGRLFTLSLHGESNYPHPKANSTYDVGLRDGCGDAEYMELLEQALSTALNEVKPDFVLYDAGVDVYEHDRLGRIDLSEAGIRRRDRWVLNQCVLRGIPVAAVIGGGYDRDVDALARRHAIVHEECSYVWRQYQMWNRPSTPRLID